ncbi:MAG: hypothetical protein H9W81_07750 [Enterococcus sp.]|nr:hypothetical protein [Enterococcus sp.]
MADTTLDNMTDAELKAVLAERKAQRAVDAAKERQERRQREQEERDAKVADYRDDYIDEFVGPTSEWLAVTIDYRGGLELTVHEGTTPQSGINLSHEDALKLRDILNTRLG